jgi:hypothetical protein
MVEGLCRCPTSYQVVNLMMRIFCRPSEHETNVLFWTAAEVGDIISSQLLRATDIYNDCIEQ